MPVRIYDIAKKLGIESKEVLARARALGITAAKVPSSSLDKITAEYLENELGGVKPAPVAPQPSVPEPILIITVPPAPEPSPAPPPPPVVPETIVPPAPVLTPSPAPAPAPTETPPGDVPP